MCIDGKVVKVHQLEPKDAIVAYRAWYYDTYEKCLKPTFSRINPWKTPKVVYKSHRVPGWKNRWSSVGIHAVKRLEGTKNAGRVYGRVKLWGRVVEHMGGYRAQYAQIEQLYAPPFIQPYLNELKKYGKVVRDNSVWVW